MACCLVGAKIYTIIWRHYATMSQYIAIQFFMNFACVMSPTIAKFCFASSFVPDLEANFMVTGFTTRDKKYIDVPILANL